MPAWEQDLVKKYSEKIMDGKHVIPTQLRQIVGMKNAFEKITAIVKEDSNLEVLHSSKHAGTLVSLTANKGLRQEITDMNAQQAQEWIGEERILHTNTLNSGFKNFVIPGIHPDLEMVMRTNTAMKNIGGI